MKEPSYYTDRLKNDLVNISTEEKAMSSRRYFPSGFICVGATAPDIKTIITDFQSDNSDLSAHNVLSITEHYLAHHHYSEDVLVAFGILNKFVGKYFDDDLLNRFEFWLENYTNNWSQVDDLCMKTVYRFLMARPHLIESTANWAHSEISWCRRASNVAWVKFIKRKIGNSTYYLNPDLVFRNCDLLIEDEDEFVQKSVGWLLKVTAAHYEEDVICYIQNNYTKMTRPTIRYAIEKLDSTTRKEILLSTR